MSQRLEYDKIAPKALMALRDLEKYILGTNLERGIFELIKIRASQINGCAFCLDMHTKDARKAGETEQRIYALPAWRETAFYSERERAALEWTETVTLISEKGAPDDVYARVSESFNAEDLVALTMAIVAINGWNRLAISFRKEPGSYNP